MVADICDEDYLKTGSTFLAKRDNFERRNRCSLEPGLGSPFKFETYRVLFYKL